MHSSSSLVVHHNVQVTNDHSTHTSNHDHSVHNTHTITINNANITIQLQPINCSNPEWEDLVNNICIKTIEKRLGCSLSLSLAMFSRASSYFARRSPTQEPADSGSGDTMPFQGTRGAKRSATSEDLVPATAPATKLHKDASGDVRTAATVTAAVPTDAAGTTPAAQPLAQLTQVEWQAILTRLTAVEQLQAQLTEAQSQLKAAEASFNRKLEEQTQSSVARENAVKDSCQQRINALDSTVEMLSQRIRARNMVVHGLPDTAAVSNTAALERLVKARVDSFGPNRGSSPISQSITAVTRIGRPGTGSRAVLVEYSSSQAKHKTYALSRQLRRQGISLTDELTPKQQQAQKALDPDRIALRSKGFRTWFRHGTLWYLDQGVPRESKQGEAVRLPQTQGSPPGPNMPAARAPPRSPSSRPRQAPRRSGGSTPTGARRANRVVPPVPASCQPPPRPASPVASPPSPSNAFVAGSDPVTAMDTGPAAPVGPVAGPSSAAAAAPSCTPTVTPPVSPGSSPAGPPAPTNPQ